MTVSIIIAVKTWQNNLEECINKCRELDFSDFEILILPDTTPKGLSPSSLNQSQNKGTVPIKIIPTGSVSPAYKRDLALSYAKGEILALLDDDAYPHQGWLKCALENFKDQDIAAVGGPAITPQGDNFKQRASGLVYSSSLASGKFTYRYLPKRRRYVDDYPSCNFLVRKSIMQELGGFKTSFWPGEDTKLCLDITHKLGKKIIYDPRVLVCHHRRPLFLPHLKQVASYALHRGYFVKKLPETSLRISYFLPSILLIGLFLGAVMSLFLIP
ncbi:MAG: glycosyltransferase, partial [Candidatus Omnitrophica bacterium]|nr:glycosyltransferase [Candidatus Omnitrophota bacterium]